MNAKVTILTIGIATLVGGCLPSDPTVGKGKITLSPAVQAGFEQYKKERSPGHFAVSEDGRYGRYNHCPEGRCYRGAKTAIIHACEKASQGSPCKIYAAYGQVVWQQADGQ
jgi:hypothetical protein